MKTQNMIVREYISSHTLQSLAGFHLHLFSTATLEKLESEDGPITDQERTSWEGGRASSEEFARQVGVQMGIQGIRSWEEPDQDIIFQVPLEWVTHVGNILRMVTRSDIAEALRPSWAPFVRKAQEMLSKYETDKLAFDASME